MNTRISIATLALTTLFLAGAQAADDQAFVKEAAMGGMFEQQAGQIAAQYGVNPEVKKFGEHMIGDHGDANKALMALAAKKGWAVPESLDEKHQAMLKHFETFQKEQFDAEYMRAMIADHKEDLQKFQDASKNLADADLRAWAASTTTTVQHHLHMAEAIAQAK